MFGFFRNKRRKKDFEIGNFVVVSAEGGWREDSEGEIIGGPEPIQTLQGSDYNYWVRFSEPAHDLSDDGPYESAQILSRFLREAR